MFRLVAIAASLFAGLLGGLYTAARADDSSDTAALVAEPGAPAVSFAIAPSPVAELEPELPVGRDFPEDPAWAVMPTDWLLDEESGLRFDLYLAPELPTDEVASTASTPRTRRASRPAAPAAPIVRLDPDPGRNVILTARGMMARHETVRGSCYRYLSEVFARAGNPDWRTRTIVHAADREGPYADLSQIRPGDWLYIVNHPETTPMGTHSVLFLGWDDRAHGYARVLQHSGHGSESAGEERVYDVSMTYRIVRPVFSGR